jgi:creatinine amidohydrolase
VKSLYLPDHTWEEIKSFSKRTKTSIIPIGSLEQHGPHLPIGTDTTIAFRTASEVSERISSLLLPPLSVGFSMEHLSFPGTVSIDATTLIVTISSICQSLSTYGFTNPIVINGHGGNVAALETAAQTLLYRSNIRVLMFHVPDLANAAYRNLYRSSTRAPPGHADEIETSLLLACSNWNLRKRHKIKELPKLPKGLSLGSPMEGIFRPWKTAELSRSGVLGDPTRASRKKGKKILETVVDRIAEVIHNCR